MTLLQIVTILLCLVAGGFFAGIETGIISIQRMRLRHFVRKGLPGARILEGFLNDTDRLLGTTLVGNNLFVVAISVVSASLFSRLLGAWGEPISAVLASMVVLLFLEYLPKAWFHSRPLERSRRFAGLLRVSELIFLPLSSTMIWVTRALVPGGKSSFRKHTPFVTREDLKLLAREGEQDGVLSPRERFMIHRVIELSGKPARQIMVPRDKITYVASDASLSEFFKIARATQFTRIPVFDKASQQFTGVINVFYVMSQVDTEQDQPVSRFARRPLFVREDTPVDDILPIMRRFRQPLCLVRDAHDQVTGLITTEDILEEIVGQL